MCHSCRIKEKYSSDELYLIFEEVDLAKVDAVHQRVQLPHQFFYFLKVQYVYFHFLFTELKNIYF